MGRKKKRAKTKASLRISDMLRLEAENNFSIASCMRINYLLRQYEALEKEENELFEHLRHSDSEAFTKAIRIDSAQDKIIAEIWELSFTVRAENQASNHLINRYDPAYMKEMVAERRKRIKNQFLLFKERSEEIAKTIKRKEKGVEKFNHRLSHQGNRRSAGCSETTLSR